MWAETGDFRDNNHSTMSSVANSMDHHTQMSFQTTSSRNRTKDRKGNYNEIIIVHKIYRKTKNCKYFSL